MQGIKKNIDEENNTNECSVFEKGSKLGKEGIRKYNSVLSFTITVLQDILAGRLCGGEMPRRRPWLPRFLPGAVVFTVSPGGKLEGSQS